MRMAEIRKTNIVNKLKNKLQSHARVCDENKNKK